VKSVTTSSLAIAYEEEGAEASTPVILLHGFPDDARCWDRVVEALTAAGLRTLAPYLRGFGATRFLRADAPRSGQLAALTEDVIEFADALNASRFVLVGHDWGARAAYNVAAVYPERVSALVALSVGFGTNLPDQTLAYDQSRAYWYQWFFATERGRNALENDRRGLCKFLWQTWSPGWRFDDSTFEATAASFDNPDFVSVAIHSYRHRWGNAEGDPRYIALEARLRHASRIAVPTTVLHGADDRATLPAASEGKEKFFSRSYKRIVVPDAGHFLPRENPEAVSRAILDACER
jgi:pimeloyl-ACP methyl ester carboxylesterase